MKRFYNVDGMTLDEAKVIIKSIEADLLYLYPIYVAQDEDSRLGNETYTYEEEDILHHLQYISDRWCASFRIAWMLGLVNKDYRGSNGS